MTKPDDDSKAAGLRVYRKLLIQAGWQQADMQLVRQVDRRLVEQEDWRQVYIELLVQGD